MKVRRGLMKQHNRSCGLLLCWPRWLLSSGCSLLSVSIEDRVHAFLADLNNADRSQVYLNFHPSISRLWRHPRIRPYWNSYFPTATPHTSITGLNTGDPTNVTVSLFGQQRCSWACTIIFRWCRLGLDWFIQDDGLLSARSILSNERSNC